MNFYNLRARKFHYEISIVWKTLTLSYRELTALALESDDMIGQELSHDGRLCID